MEVSGHYHTAAALLPWKNGACWIRGWVGPRSGLDDLEKGRISYRYLDSNLGPSIPSPSRYPVAVLGIWRRVVWWSLKTVIFVAAALWTSNQSHISSNRSNLELKAILFASVGSMFVSLQLTSVSIIVQQRIFPLPSPSSVTVSPGDNPRYDSPVSLVLCTNVYWDLIYVWFTVTLRFG